MDMECKHNLWLENKMIVYFEMDYMDVVLNP